MKETKSKSVTLTNKARNELRSALYQEIGKYAKAFTDKDLDKFGSFLLHSLAISHKIKLRESKEKKASK